MGTLMKCVALLPMKAHSERVPGKNFKFFAGKPLYRWVLDRLLSVENISQVVINTDARNILEETGLLESERVVIRDRAPDLCGDFVSMNKIIEDDLANIEADCYLMTHTTNPLVRTETFAKALSRYSQLVGTGTRDSLFTVNKFQTRFYRGDGSAINHDPNNLLRTQDLEPWYEENSCIYLFSRSSFNATNARIGIKPELYEIPKIEALDIDNREDWLHAETLAIQGISNV